MLGTNYVIEKRGTYYKITFENGHRQTTVTLAPGLAVKFITELQGRIERDMAQEEIK